MGSHLTETLCIPLCYLPVCYGLRYRLFRHDDLLFLALHCLVSGTRGKGVCGFPHMAWKPYQQSQERNSQLQASWVKQMCSEGSALHSQWGNLTGSAAVTVTQRQPDPQTEKFFQMRHTDSLIKAALLLSQILHITTQACPGGWQSDERSADSNAVTLLTASSNWKCVGLGGCCILGLI